jgi:anion-transporting  ArsA/GET3 family ATPase
MRRAARLVRVWGIVAESSKSRTSERNGIKQCLKAGHTVILLGTGGVGKTTIAAALGIASATVGNHTAVITIDPARRLRDALGLRRLGYRPTHIDPRRLARAGLDPGLALFAMVLDVKHQWNAMVEGFIADRATRERILANRFYRMLAGQLAGSDAYAALEALYDLHEKSRFEVTIVDTPPAAHAFEFIQAPGRMARLLDSGAARLFSSASAFPGSRLAFRFASRASRRVMEELERFTGTEVLSSIADFFTSAAAATGAMVERFRKAERMLRSSTVHFVIVTTAEPDRLSHARELTEELAGEGLSSAAIVINRFLDEEASDIGANGRDGAMMPSGFRDASKRDPEVRRAVDYLEDYQRRLNMTAARVGEFIRELPDDVAIAAAPELAIETADLAMLRTIAEHLTQADSMSIGMAKPNTLRRRAARTGRKSKPE